MKLLTKSTFYYFLFSIVVVIAIGTSLYFAIRKDVYAQIDSSLITEKDLIKDQVDNSDSIPSYYSTFGHQIEVKRVGHSAKHPMVLKDTIIIDDSTNTYIIYRYLSYTGKTPKGEGYRISLLQIFSERKELLKDMAIYMFSLFLCLLVISILMNYLISKKLWSPFYKSVEKAGSYDILSDRPLELPETDVIEFKELNSVFEKMTMKMRADYLNLKEYNEDAAHEIQTPLAIIRSKLELLMQNKKLNKESLGLIKSINEATSKLFKLNQGLLLISKIENQYFHEKKALSLKIVIDNCLLNYKEIMELKGISVEFAATDDAVIEFNEMLADIMITNLISNAVRYNVDNGFIKITLDEKSLKISNSGQPLRSDPENLFKRFQKESDNPHSVGLGLSIVKKISDTYGMSISYLHSASIHTVMLYYRS